MARRHELLALVLAGCACDRLELSDESQYWLDAEPVQRTPALSDRVLVGSEFSVRISELAVEGEVDEDGGGLECATQSASGVLEEFDDDRFRVTGLGAGAVLFAPPIISCPENDDVLITLGPDSWTITGVGAEGLEGRYMPLYDTYLATLPASPGSRGAFPDSIGRPLENLLVAGEQHFVAVTMLIDPDDGLEVRYSEEQALVEVPAHFADVIDPEGDIDRNHLDGTLQTGESFTPTFSVLGQTYPIGDIRAVPVDHIGGFEVVPFYAPGDTQREWGPPQGILAIARDFEGRRVVGAPIEWEVTSGRVTIDAYDSDLLLLNSTCRRSRAPEYRYATIEARMGDISSEVEFEWIALPEDEVANDSRCVTAGCGCTSTRSDSVPAWAAFVLGLGLVARRRLAHSKRRSAASTEATKPDPNSTTCTSSG